MNGLGIRRCMGGHASASCWEPWGEFRVILRVALCQKCMPGCTLPSSYHCKTNSAFEDYGMMYPLLTVIKRLPPTVSFRSLKKQIGGPRSRVIFKVSSSIKTEKKPSMAEKLDFFLLCIWIFCLQAWTCNASSAHSGVGIRSRAHHYSLPPKPAGFTAGSNFSQLYVPHVWIISTSLNISTLSQHKRQKVQFVAVVLLRYVPWNFLTCRSTFCLLPDLSLVRF